MRSSAPEILASESIRNRPLATTFSPSCSPLRMAVTPADSWNTCTSFGTKRPSLSTVITRCSLPLSISALEDQQHRFAFTGQLQIGIHPRLQRFIRVVDLQAQLRGTGGAIDAGEKGPFVDAEGFPGRAGT